MSISRSLCWKLNWYRQSELDGALLLGKAVRAAADPRLIAEMTHHAADEARHADLWSQTIAELGCGWVRILRSYQSYYGQFGLMPVTITEVLAITHVFEKRVWRQFQQEVENPAWPAAARATFERLLEDERQHLQWVQDFLAETGQTEELLAQYADVDRQVYEHLRPFEDRLWEAPGLGVELETAMNPHEHSACRSI